MMKELSMKDLKNLICRLPGHVAVYKLVGGCLRTLYISKGIAALSGMTSQEYQHWTEGDALKIVVDSDRNYVRQSVEKCLHSFREDNCIYRIYHKIHGAIWIHGNVSVLGEEGGCPVLYTSFMEITQVTARYDELLDHSQNMVLVVEAATHEILYANQAAHKLGISSQNALGKYCYQALFHKENCCEDCPLGHSDAEGFQQAEKYIPEVHRYYQMQYQKINWYGRRAYALYARDITEEVEKRTILQAKKDGLQRILDHLPVGICVYQLQGKETMCIAANRYYCAMVHRSEEELLAETEQTFLQDVHPEDVQWVREDRDRVLEPPYHVRNVFRQRQPDGSYRWIQVEGQGVCVSEDTLLSYVCYIDVTVEKEALEALQESTKRYESAVEAARLTAWEYDLRNHRITMMDNPVTQAECKRLGLPKVIENVPESLKKWMLPEDWKISRAMYERLEEGLPSVSCDVWYRRNERFEPICTRIFYTTVYDAQGRPVKAYGIGQDVTHQVVEEQKYHQFLQEILVVNPQSRGTFHLNITRNLCGSGHGVSPLVQQQQQAGTMDGFFATIARYIVSPEDRKKLLQQTSRENLLKAFREGKKVIECRYRRIIEDRRIHWVTCYIHILQNPLTGDIEAVTDAVDMEEKMRDELILKHVTNEEFDFLAIVDPTTGSLNYRAVKNTLSEVVPGIEYDYEEKIAFFIRCIKDPQERENARHLLSLRKLAIRLAKRGRYEYPVTVCYPNGQVYHKLLRFCLLELSEQHILVIQNDVTEAFLEEQQRTKMLEERSEQLRTALAAAQQATQAKSEFLSRMSHDIRTPMNAIMGMSTIAQLKIADPIQVKDCLEKIDTSSQYLLSLINDILDISRIEAGKMSLRDEPFDFEVFIQSIVTMAYPQAQALNLDFSIQAVEPLAKNYYGDVLHLKQILMNLISNALKFTPAKGHIQLRIYEEKQANGYTYLVFIVQDDGQGMTEEFQEKMFRPFEQEGVSKARNKVGSGLGLAIVYNLVHLMGGQIQVQSEKGVGTTFKLTIPLRKKESVQQAEILLQEDQKVLAGLSILVVDDDDLVGEQVPILLADAGVEAEWVSSGKAALQKVENLWEKQRYYDVALIDWKMPEMDGIATAKAIRKHLGPEVTIIIMSAYDWNEIEACARQAGVDYFITKPLMRRNLYDVLKQIQVKRTEPVAQILTDPVLVGKRILLAEDNALNAEIAMSLLEYCQFKVDHVLDGGEALRKWREQPPGTYFVILMDIRMPNLDGIEAAKAIRQTLREDAQKIPILAMTADAFDEDRNRALRAGMNGYIIKPFDLAKLLDELKKWI